MHTAFKFAYTTFNNSTYSQKYLFKYHTNSVKCCQVLILIRSLRQCLTYLYIQVPGSSVAEKPVILNQALHGFNPPLREFKQATTSFLARPYQPRRQFLTSIEATQDFKLKGLFSVMYDSVKPLNGKCITHLSFSYQTAMLSHFAGLFLITAEAEC